MKNTFRSFEKYNYRVWALGSIISNIGTWMQRIAQDWLVLSELTQHSGTAVGIIMALQFGPPILLISFAGRVVDKVDHRKLLIFTQLFLALTAFLLGILVLTHSITLWEVYLFAGLVGCISAFDSPARQIFITELVGESNLPNALALNSILFNSAQLTGPAIAGIFISLFGSGWVFILNGMSFIVVIVSLTLLKKNQLFKSSHVKSTEQGLVHTLSYIKQKPELMIVLVMLFILGTYGLNFPVYISTMTINVFHGNAHLFGILSSTMAIGSILGGIFVANKKYPNLQLLILSSLLFFIVGSVAAWIPSEIWFGIMLASLGALTQVFTTTTNSFVQLTTAPEMRGRVMAVYMGIFLGCTPLGAPFAGWIADILSPRWSLFFAALSGGLAALVGYVFKKRVHKFKTHTI
ncbi:MAG: MFS transporter [Betaproteobacteria bacterium]|nr:MFS transporter [Betaproteobacteria bacterium]MDE2424244.1 MFS transporter [Betaproteobacteria bacterium]